MINLMLGFSLGHKLKQLASWRQLLGSKEVRCLPPLHLPPISLCRQLLSSKAAHRPPARTHARPLASPLTPPSPSVLVFPGSPQAGISPRTMGVLTLGKMIALPVFHGAAAGRKCRLPCLTTAPLCLATII